MFPSLSAKSSVGHYENFPVASHLLPKRYRASVMALYRFARTADDIADEGEDAPWQRQQKLSQLLQSFEQFFSAPTAQSLSDPYQAVSAPMADLCRAGLPAQYPRALISAFVQDTQTTRYTTMAEILDYATRSANPVGRSLLYFFNRHDEPWLSQSDCICSALQLINFWQDVAIDWRKNRLYIPAQFFHRFALDEAGGEINQYCQGAPVSLAWRDLMRSLIAHARTLILQGASLPRAIGGRAGFELQVVIQGGLRILEKIEAVEGDVFRHRPRLRRYDGGLIFIRALRQWL